METAIAGDKGAAGRVRTVDASIIALLFTVVNGLLYSKIGVKFVADSPRYIEYAANLKGGLYFDSHNFWYIGYVLFIFIVKLFSDHILSIVVIQYSVALLALLLLFKTSILLWKDRAAAYGTVLLFLLFVDVSQWNSYVLAESIYVVS